MIAIGNGTVCRETEEIVSELIAELESPADGQPAVPDLAYVIVNEAGASVYSASPVGREEFPNFDATPAAPSPSAAGCKTRSASWSRSTRSTSASACTSTT